MELHADLPRRIMRRGHTGLLDVDNVVLQISMAPPPQQPQRIFRSFQVVFVLAQNLAPGGILGRKIAESMQKAPENLKIRPETLKHIQKSTIRPNR